MKHKRLILLLSVFIIFTIYIFYPYLKDKETTDGFKREVIRFHIRANSDKKEDQELKLKIRDKILQTMGDKFEGTQSLEESREVILDNIEELKSIAERVIEDEGMNYNVNISLGQDSFPIRRYGQLVFPQGQYETLMMEIGEGKGQNWWCVMFPPLCFVDVTYSLAIEVDGQLGDYLLDETQPLKLKSKLAELYRKYFSS